MRNRDRVPAITLLSGKLVLDNKFRIVTASDIDAAEEAAVTASATGSVGAEEFYYEVAGPFVSPEQRKIERWAIVERA